MSADVSELHTLARDLDNVPTRLTPKVAAVMRKSGLQIRKRIQNDVSKSIYFKGAQFPFHVDEQIDDEGMTVEVYPGHGLGLPASLYNIAVFGGARGGGGTVREPTHALAAEADLAEKHLGDLLDGIL